MLCFPVLQHYFILDEYECYNGDDEDDDDELVNAMIMWEEEQEMVSDEELVKCVKAIEGRPVANLLCKHSCYCICMKLHI